MATLFKKGKQGRRSTVAVIFVLLGVGSAGYAGWWFVKVQQYPSLVRSLLATNRPDLAAKLTDEWIRLQPSSAEAYALRCRARWMAFQFREAGRDLKQARSFGWPREVCELESLLIQAKGGHFNKVEPALRAVFLSKATVDPEVNAALAKGYVERYKFNQAVICLKEWMAISPKDLRPYLWRAEIYERLPDREESALNDYLKVASIDSNHYDAHFKAAQTLLKLARFEQAEQYYTRCLKLRPKDADACFGLARCANAEGNVTEAAALIQRTLELQPRHAPALREQAQIHLANNRADLAVERLRLSIEHDPSSEAAYYSLALALARLGDRIGAEQARATYESMVQTIEKLETLRVKLLERPDDIATLQEIVTLYQKHGNRKNAARWAQVILELDPQNHAAQDAIKQFRQNPGL